MLSCRVGDDLELRSLDETEAEVLFSLVDSNRQHLGEWLPWVDTNNTVTDSLEFIRSSAGRLACGVWHRGKMAGVIGFHEIDWVNRKASIGYWLAAAFQGRGIITGACRAVVEHAISTLGLNRLEILCAVENTRSRAIPERLGFIEEGVLQEALWLYDRYVDVAIYGLLASEWKKGR